MNDLTIQQEEHGTRGAFFIVKDGARAGEMTFSRTGPAVVRVDHTEVTDALKGTGAGRKLLDALVAWARSSGTKVVPVCPYVKAQFDKDPALGDVRAQ